jgi:signal transduction histidine kinase
MNATPTAQDALLSHSEVVGIELDEGGRALSFHNAALLTQWLGDEAAGPLPDGMEALFEQLFGSRHLPMLREGLRRLAQASSPRSIEIAVLTTRARAGAFTRQLSIVWLPATGATGRTLLLQDVSRREILLQELQEMRSAQQTTLAVLRAPPDGLRLFLGSALASISAIRATVRMPARTQNTLHEKLGRLHTEAAALGAEARMLQLSPVASSCQALADAAASLQARETISGDDLLPLAPRIDAIASAIGATSRIEEQRYEPPPAVCEPARQSRRGASWHEVSERRWSEFLRRRGESVGTLARLTMSGAELVPTFHRRHIDEILQHLLKNAVDHGIETPEARLGAGKSAAGRITIGFSRVERSRLRMTVHDDGRGFDLTRIGRAAVHSGLVSEESLVRREAGELVGLIFKPSFTTEGLDTGDGQGRGMSYLRRKITRLGGQISVATKQGRYTLFTIELPESEISDEPAGVIPHATP